VKKGLFMNSLLVVEDSATDLKAAAEAATEAGIPVVESQTTARGAREFLEKGLRGDGPLPDGILLDLDLGHESGFEVLRFWHSTPRLKAIPLVVWTILGQEQRDICGLFKVNGFISKWEGAAAFKDALNKMSVEN
jgi:CheY-like chemotaxis protein